MTIVLTENWSSYPVDIEVQNIAGWAVSGSGSAQQAGIKITNDNAIKGITYGYNVAYYDAGSPNHSASCVLMVTPKSGVVSAGAAVRVIDFDNQISMRPYGTSKIEVYKIVAGNLSRLALITHSHTVNDEYTLEVEDDTLKLLVDSVQIGSDIDVSGVASSSNAGFTINHQTSSAIGAVQIESLSSTTMTIDSYPNRKVFAVFGSSRSHTISGTYSGVVTPSAIEYRIEDYVSGAVISDWSSLDSSPVGGVFSGTVSIPKGNYYKILTRFSNDTAITAETNRIGFGLLIGTGGQSNMAGMFGASGTDTPLDDTCFFDGAQWVLPTNQPINSALNAISTANNCVVATYDTAISSSDIDAHLPLGSNYNARTQTLTDFGGKLNGFLWGQGEADTGTAGQYNSYQNKLGQLHLDILTRTGQLSDTLPFFIVQLGRKDGATTNDVGWQSIREAQVGFCDATQDAYISHQTMDLSMTDSLHRDANGRKQEALRFADTFNSVVLGTGDTGRGVTPISVLVSDNEVDIKHDLNGSTAITLPSNAADGYEVSDDDFTTTIAINSISTSTDTITLTLSNTPTGIVKVRSQQGADPDPLKMPLGDKLRDGQAAMVAPMVYAVSASVISSVFNLTATNTPNGSYSTKFYNDDTGTIIDVDSLTFSGGSASKTLNVAVGTNVFSLTKGGNPPTTGMCYIGVTE